MRPECQKLDFKNHKIFCANFVNSERPSPVHRRALLFPGSDAPPRLQWVRLVLCTSSDGKIEEGFSSQAEFGEETQVTSSLNFNAVQGRTVARVKGEALHWFTKENAPSTEPLNTGLQKFTRSGSCWEGFSGPVFILRAITDDQGQVRHLDMNLRDVRSAADSLGQAYRDGRIDVNLSKVHVIGTKIASDRVESTGVAKYESLVIVGCDHVWSAFGSSIANLLGLPLLCSTGPTPLEQQPSPELRNFDATLLYRDVTTTHVRSPLNLEQLGEEVDVDEIYRQVKCGDIKPAVARQLTIAFTVGVRGFGSSVLRFDKNKVGCSYVVRADGKPLPAQHVEALCGFIKDKIEPQLQAAISGLTDDQLVPDRERILDYIRRAEFEKYYEEFKAAKVEAGDESWRHLSSPYEITSKDVKDDVRKMTAAQEASGRQGLAKMAREMGHDGVTADMTKRFYKMIAPDDREYPDEFWAQVANNIKTQAEEAGEEA